MQVESSQLKAKFWQQTKIQLQSSIQSDHFDQSWVGNKKDQELLKIGKVLL